MSVVKLYSAGSNSGKSATKELWLETFYFSVPWNILNKSNNYSRMRTGTVNYVNILFEFLFQKISDLQFKIICTRKPVSDSFPDGDYKIQFYCDIFDGDSKMFEMQSVETVAEVKFSLKESRQDLPLPDFEKTYDAKIRVKMIEYDIALTKIHILQRDLFREENKEIFSNESMLRDLCYILKVQRLEDIFTGRQNLEYFEKKSLFIKRASQYYQNIATYMQCKEESTMPTGRMLKYILQGTNSSLSDSDLVNIYNKAHYLGLEFLIQLSQDIFLDRLAKYQMNSLEKCKACMFRVIKAACGVNDEKFLDQVLTRLNITESFIDSQPLSKIPENSRTSSKFAIHFAYRRLEKINSDRNNGNGEASSSKDI